LSHKILEWWVSRRKSKVLTLAERQIDMAMETVKLLDEASGIIFGGSGGDPMRAMEALFAEEESIDDVRREIFEELSRGEMQPRDREDLMHLVKRIDVLADYIKDSARDLMTLKDSNLPAEIRALYSEMVRGLRECANALRGSIEKLGSDVSEAVELSKDVDRMEHSIDDAHLKSKSLLIKYGGDMNPAVLMILKDLADHLEGAADVCADTADYVRILAAGASSKS
jgi:predicted phosphate transport protein (TIGR00153 family)